MHGLAPNIRLILNQDSTARADRMLAYYNAFLAAQAEALKEMQESGRQLQAVEKRIAAMHRQSRSLHKKLQVEEKTLLDEQRRRHKVVARLGANESREGGPTGASAAGRAGTASADGVARFYRNRRRCQTAF